MQPINRIYVNNITEKYTDSDIENHLSAAIAFTIPTEGDIETQFKTNYPKLESIVSSINESRPVDYDRIRELTVSLYKTRVEILKNQSIKHLTTTSNPFNPHEHQRNPQLLLELINLCKMKLGQD